MIVAIVGVRRRFPRFGPNKIRARLALDEPGIELPTISYDGAHRRDHHMARRTWRGEPAVIGQALTGDVVAIAEVEGGGYLERFCDRRLGLIDAEGLFHRFAPPRWRRRSPVRQAEVDEQSCQGCSRFKTSGMLWVVQRRFRPRRT